MGPTSGQRSISPAPVLNSDQASSVAQATTTAAKRSIYEPEQGTQSTRRRNGHKEGLTKSFFFVLGTRQAEQKPLCSWRRGKADKQPLLIILCCQCYCCCCYSCSATSDCSIVGHPKNTKTQDARQQLGGRLNGSEKRSWFFLTNHNHHRHPHIHKYFLACIHIVCSAGETQRERAPRYHTPSTTSLVW